MPHSCWLTSFDKNGYCNELKSIHISPIVGGNFCWVKIQNYQSHDSHAQSPIAATIPFPKTNFSMINPNIMNSQLSTSCMNLNDVIIKYTKYQKETQNLTKKLQIITHRSTLQSARNVHTRNPNPETTDQRVHSILAMNNLQLGGCLYKSYWPKSLQLEDSQCNHAQIAMPHPQQQQCIVYNQQRDQVHSFGLVEGVAAVWSSCFEDSVRNFGSLVCCGESSWI